MVELWNSDDCANFFRCSQRHFMERIAPVPTFPQRRYIPTVSGRAGPYWVAKDVMFYAVPELSQPAAEPRAA